MRCAALDTYSYAEVSVTAKRLTVAMKDAKGSRCARRRASRAPRSSSPPANGGGRPADYPHGGRP